MRLNYYLVSFFVVILLFIFVFITFVLIYCYNTHIYIYNNLINFCLSIEVIRSSEKEYTNKIKRLETTANDLKKELSQEKKKCTEIQNDLSSCTQREANMTETISTVNTITVFVLL